MAKSVPNNWIPVRSEGGFLFGEQGKRFLHLQGSYWTGNPDKKEYKLEQMGNQLYLVPSNIGINAYNKWMQEEAGRSAALIHV